MTTSENQKWQEADAALTGLHLDIFTEDDAPRYLRSNMLRVTFAADYAKRLDFMSGEIIRAITQAVDVLQDPTSPVVIRAKAQLLLDSAKLSHTDIPSGPFADYIKGVQGQ